MSETKPVRRFRVACDAPDCGTYVDLSAKDEAEARRKARASGFECVSGNRDYCREHT